MYPCTKLNNLARIWFSWNAVSHRLALYSQSTFGTFIRIDLRLLEVCMRLSVVARKFASLLCTGNDHWGYEFFPFIYSKFSPILSSWRQWGVGGGWGACKHKMVYGPKSLSPFCPMCCWKLSVWFLEDKKPSSEQVSNLWNLYLKWIWRTCLKVEWFQVRSEMETGRY